MKLPEISRFTGSGKTFFFNKGIAKNNTEYLAINAIYGKGMQERMILFPPHLLEFRKHLESAITQLTGASFATTPVVEPEPKGPFPFECKCGAEYGGYRLGPDANDNLHLYCSYCMEPVEWEL